MSAVPLSMLATSRRWQTNFLAVLPAVQRHAKVCFHRLRPTAKAEATAEAVASAVVSYQVLVRRKRLGRAYPGTLASFAVRAVKGGRHVGGHINSKDVLSPLAQQRHGLHVQSLSRWDHQENDWHDMALESRRVTPAEQAIFNLDFQAWLAGWSYRHRQIIHHLAAGHRTMAVARKFGVSEGRVSQLRRHYEQSWRQFQGVAEVDVAA